MELTVPHEDNISAAHERKEKRYEALVEECEEAGWKALLFAVEVGCRGFIGESARKWMKVAGLGKKTREHNDERAAGDSRKSESLDLVEER